MYKYISIAVFLISLATSAQVNTEKVLIELGTATWNSACANEASILEELKSQGLDIAVVNYHLNDPFGNVFANDRGNYYSIQSVPFPIVQGQEIDYGAIQNYLDAYNIAINELSAFELNVAGGFLQDTLYITVNTEKIASYESDALKLHCVLTESDIHFEWWGLNEVNDVERSMSPDADGSILDFSSSSSVESHLQIFIEDFWNLTNMQLVCFLQDDENKQVLQCQTASLIDFAPLPVIAFFEVEDSLICRKESVAFLNSSSGDVETVEWYFEGGTPGNSSIDNPTISYNEAGEFDVQLIVSNSISTDTSKKYNLIEVIESPEMSFAPLPSFCHNDPPYLLTEGWPEEGQYFGPFVETGYFHPEPAGPGAYTLYFTYEDEITGCSDTLSQIAVVELCSGLERSELLTSKTFLNWKWVNEKLYLKIDDKLAPYNSAISIYTTGGQLLYLVTLSNQDELFIELPFLSGCFLVQIKNIYSSESLKICR
jgi:hypothetical protein